MKLKFPAFIICVEVTKCVKLQTSRYKGFKVGIFRISPIASGILLRMFLLSFNVFVSDILIPSIATHQGSGFCKVDKISVRISLTYEVREMFLPPPPPPPPPPTYTPKFQSKGELLSGKFMKVSPVWILHWR